MLCHHKNIYWEDLFKPEKQSNNNYHHRKVYCLDCKEEKHRQFARVAQKWYVEKVREWLKDNKLTRKFINHKGEETHSDFEFYSFLKKNNFDKQWNELQVGQVDGSDYFDGLGGQMIFFEVARSIEHLCQEFKKEKEQEKPNDPNKDNPNQRERAKIQSDINNLADKPNKTAEEEDELAKLKTKLKELEDESKKPIDHEQTNALDKPWLMPALIISVFLIIFIFLLAFIRKKKK